MSNNFNKVFNPPNQEIVYLRTKEERYKMALEIIVNAVGFNSKQIWDIANKALEED